MPFLLGLTSLSKKTSLIPPGFVLIQGTDSIPSFIMGENMVSNYEYLLYLHWLKKVMVDYPEISHNATPKIVDSFASLLGNDPFNTSYFGHPAYADYPVVGVNWYQAMEYCSWRTDRLNEAYLIEVGNMDLQAELQHTWDENNFNTEAYLNGQYDFSQRPKKNHEIFGYQRRKASRDWEKPYEYSAARKINDPARNPDLLYGCRLPSEEEWDLFMKERPSQNGPWHAEASYTSIASYLGISEVIQKAYGKKRDHIRTLESNYQEWMLDTFNIRQSKNGSQETRLSRGGLYPFDPQKQWIDSYGALREKDSMGRFPFQIMGWKPSGEAMCTWRSGYELHWMQCTILTKHSTAFNDSIESIYKSNHLDSLRRTNNSYFYYPYFYGTNCKILGYCTYFDIGSMIFMTVMPNTFVSKEEDLKFLTETAVYQYNAQPACEGCDKSNLHNRVVKNAKNRVSVPDKSGNPALGFRVLIPWHNRNGFIPVAW